MVDNRDEAIKWWESLDPTEQRGYFLDYKAHNESPALVISQLTGWAIEKIWREKEMYES